MKKIMAALLALSLAACSKDSPEAVLKQAYDKDKDTQSITMDGEMTIDVTVEGFTLSIPVDIDVRTDTHDKDTVVDDEVYIDLSLSLLGESMQMSYLIKDGKAYIDLEGEKTMTDLEITDTGEKPDRDAAAAQIVSAMDDLAMEKDGDNTIISGKVNKDKILELLENALSKYGETASLDTLKESFDSVDFGTIRIVIGKDGYISRVETEGSIAIEGSVGVITVAFDLKDRNATKIPTVNPADYQQASEEVIIDNVVDDVIPGGDETDFEFDDYTTEIWFDSGADYWIRSPQSENVSLYYSEEDQELYFFDTDDVLAAGMFIETDPMIVAAAGIINDEENYRILRADEDRGMNIIEGLCLNETDLMYEDTQFLIVLYPERSYSLVIFSNTMDQDRFSEVMKLVDFDLAH